MFVRDADVISLVNEKYRDEKFWTPITDVVVGENGRRWQIFHFDNIVEVNDTKFRCFIIEQRTYADKKHAKIAYLTRLFLDYIAQN